MITYCTAEFISDRGGPTLACDKPNRPHLIHHDPATGVRYMRSLRGIFCLCGFFRHRKTCPLDTRPLNGITGQGKNPPLQRVAEKYSSDRYLLWQADGKAAS